MTMNASMGTCWMRGALALVMSMPSAGFAATLAAGGDQACAIDAIFADGFDP